MWKSSKKQKFNYLYKSGCGCCRLCARETFASVKGTNRKFSLRLVFCHLMHVLHEGWKVFFAMIVCSLPKPFSLLPFTVLIYTYM